MTTHATGPLAGLTWLKRGVNLGRQNARAVFGAAAILMFMALVPSLLQAMVQSLFKPGVNGSIAMAAAATVLSILILSPLVGGYLRLIDAAGGNLKKAREIVDAELAKVDWLDKGRDRDFYAIGGTWRALAKLHMTQTGYPLNVMHNYRIETADALKFASVLDQQSQSSLAGIRDISSARRESLVVTGIGPRPSSASQKRRICVSKRDGTSCQSASSASIFALVSSLRGRIFQGSLPGL